ncbi:MAG: T9SS type A sorting domain-containing protein [Prevotellaceae bacterium]|nr:T9SS type A sorting domain-containing protein [Prevotellaceae bacterium]
MFDNTGRLLMQTGERTVDLSSYSQGVYFFKVNGKVLKVHKK